MFFLRVLCVFHLARPPSCTRTWEEAEEAAETWALTWALANKVDCATCRASSWVKRGERGGKRGREEEGLAWRRRRYVAGWHLADVREGWSGGRTGKRTRCFTIRCSEGRCWEGGVPEGVVTQGGATQRGVTWHEPRPKERFVDGERFDYVAGMRGSAEVMKSMCG